MTGTHVEIIFLDQNHSHLSRLSKSENPREVSLGGSLKLLVTQLAFRWINKEKSLLFFSNFPLIFIFKRLSNTNNVLYFQQTKCMKYPSVFMTYVIKKIWGSFQ